MNFNTRVIGWLARFASVEGKMVQQALAQQDYAPAQWRLRSMMDRLAAQGMFTDKILAKRLQKEVNRRELAGEILQGLASGWQITSDVEADKIKGMIQSASILKTNTALSSGAHLAGGTGMVQMWPADLYGESQQAGLTPEIDVMEVYRKVEGDNV